jgi:hypothetical protein
MKTRRSFLNRLLRTAVSLAVLAAPMFAQGRGEPGKSIGTISVRGDLIVMTLNEGALGKENLFNLAHHTLRFTPEASGYRAETAPFHWDSDFGSEMSGSQATLKNFSFPFSAKSWNAFSVGITGSMSFGETVAGGRGGRCGRGGGAGPTGRGGGISVERFAELAQASRTLINTIPAISVFFKPRMSGTRYLKELEDRAVITWNLTEPAGGVQDMTWHPTVNRFQAVLYKDGSVEMSYDDVAAQDAIVGLYPVVSKGEEKEIGSIAGEGTPAPPHLDIKSVKLAAVDGLFLKAVIETRGPVLPENDPAISSIGYRICLNARKPSGDCTASAQAAGLPGISLPEPAFFRSSPSRATRSPSRAPCPKATSKGTRCCFGRRADGRRDWGGRKPCASAGGETLQDWQVPRCISLPSRKTTDRSPLFSKRSTT